MAETIDERWRNVRITDADISAEDYYTGVDSVLGSEIGSVTSRDQIIDPYSVINSAYYKNNPSGRRQYEADLARAQQYAERQEAAYQEWYNSEEQQIARQREAGLNPDLIGIDSGNAVASDTSPSQNVPGANTPTSAEQAATVAGSVFGALGTVGSLVASVVSAGATLAALPATIGATVASADAAKAAKGLTEAQTLATNVATAKTAEGYYYNDIVNLLATAKGEFIDKNKGNPEAKFDINSWLANKDNFTGLYETYAPQDIPLFQNAYKRAFKQVARMHGDASRIGADAATNQSEFMQALANPYYDSNELFQLAALEPVQQAMETLRLKKVEFDTKYLEASDPEREAAAKLLQLEAQSIIESTSAKIRSHFMSIWNDKSKPFDVRAGALYQIQGMQHRGWAQWLVSYSAAEGIIPASNSDPALPTSFDTDVTERMFGDMNVTPLQQVGYNFGKNFFK